MSLEAAWNEIEDWPPLATSGGTFSSLGRPDALVAYIEGGVNYWDNGHTQLIECRRTGYGPGAFGGFERAAAANRVPRGRE